MTRDVTERRRAERALRKSEERYRAVVQQTADAIFLIDGATRRILEANAGFHALLGYAPEELHGMSMYELVPHDREGVDANIRQVLSTKATTSASGPIVERTGSWSMWRSVPASSIMKVAGSCVASRAI